MPVTAPLFTPSQLDTIQSDKPDYRAAVAVVRSKDGRYLLGLGKNTGDDRTGMWCHPGGHVDNCYDSTLDTARRECLEETGVLCTPVAQLPGDPGVPDVAFVYCETGDSSVPECKNGEHADTGMFSVADMRTGLGAPVYHNVRKIIRQAERYRRNRGTTAASGRIVASDRIVASGRIVASEGGNPNHDEHGKFTSGSGTGKGILALQASREAVHSTASSASNLIKLKTDLLRRQYKLSAGDVAGLTTNEASKQSLAAMSAMAAHDYEIGEQSHLATAREHGQHAQQLQKLIERGGFDPKTIASLHAAKKIAMEGVERHMAGAKYAHSMLTKMPESHTLVANIKRVALTVKRIYKYCTANKIVKAVIPFVIAECLSVGVHLITGVPLPEAIGAAAAVGIGNAYHHLHEHWVEHHEHVKRERENRERQASHAKLKGYGLV
jgi:8-oxo-dGTP pyrophosphatase MutT (NUDIX family)